MIDRERIPCIHVLAGTNGAGKSSVGGAMFRESGAEYFNPDEAAQRFHASGQTLVIRPYKKNPRKNREEKISFTIFDENTQSYVGKFYAYAASNLSVELHRGNGHKVLFNTNPKFPQILEKVSDVQLPKPVRKKKIKFAP